MKLKTRVIICISTVFILCGCSCFNSNGNSNTNNSNVIISQHSLVVNDNTEVYVYGSFGSYINEVSLPDDSRNDEEVENMTIISSNQTSGNLETKIAKDTQFRSYVVSDVNNTYALVGEELFCITKNKVDKVCNLDGAVGLIGCNDKNLYFYDDIGIGRYSFADYQVENNYIIIDSQRDVFRAVVNAEDLVLSHIYSGQYSKVVIYNDEYDEGKISATVGDPAQLDIDALSDILPNTYSVITNKYLSGSEQVALMKQEGVNLVNAGCDRFEFIGEIGIYSLVDNNLLIKKQEGSNTLGYQGKLSFQDTNIIQNFSRSNYRRDENYLGGDYTDLYFDMYCPKEYWNTDYLRVYEILTEKYTVLYETDEYRILGYDATNDYIYLFDVPSNTVKRLENTTQTMTDVFTVEDAEIIRFWWSGNDLIWMYENGGVVTYGGYKEL